MKSPKEKKSNKFVDDGRVIASMNIEGMPGYNPQKEASSDDSNKERITKKESFWVLSGAFLAGFLVVLVIALGMFFTIMLFIK